MIRKSRERKQDYIRYIIWILVLILGMQLFDSYCFELYGKLQSLFLSEFLIGDRGMEQEVAVGYLNLVMLPFYAITSLAPAARSLIDLWGKERVFILNLLILISGCLVCMLAPNLIIYLLGNAIVNFACTMDIQYIYIVEDVPECWRATIRGIAGGVAAGAGMSIPVFRRVLIGDLHVGWRSMYGVGIVIGIGICLYSILFLAIQDKMRRNNCSVKGRLKKPMPKFSIKQILVYIWKNREIRWNLILLFIMGSATAGITFYNEPMVSFSGMSEKDISLVLFLQPVITLIVTVLSGIAADRMKRSSIIVVNTIVAGISVSGFCFGIICHVPLGIIGVLWGAMVGSYFSAANLLTLMVMESAPNAVLGKVSAVAAYVNGSGNAVGMLLAGLLVSHIHMMPTKLFLTLPAFLVVLCCLLRIQRSDT